MSEVATPSPENLDELLARARTGDRAALEELLATVAPAIHRFGRRMCKNAADADDVVQEAMINIAKSLGDFEGRSSLSSWVFAITRSACARKRRGLKNQPPVSDDAVKEEVDRAPNPETRAADRELSNVLSNALDALPDGYREVILLRDVEGLSAPETAISLGVSVDAVKSRLHRARESLRDLLRPTLEPLAPNPSSACPDIVAMWSRKLEGDLSQGDCSTMERHLETCPSCGTACDALKRALMACNRVRTEDVPVEVQASVKAALREFSSAHR